MKKSLDFEVLYKTEFLDNSGKNKSILGIRFDPVPYVLMLAVIVPIVALFVGMVSLIILPDELYTPIHDFIDYYILGPGSVLFILLVIFLPFSGIISYFTSDHNFKKYALKEETLQPLVKSINPTFKYIHKNYIKKDIFVNSKLYTNHISSYSGNDLIMGKLEGNYIMFSDLLVKSVMQTTFQGHFLVTEFNKNFKGTTVVSTDNAEVIFGNVLGGFIQSTLSGDGLVRMDNPDFEEAFVVHSTDSVEAHYILTASLMERILKYQEKTKHQIEFSFVDNNLYLAIVYGKDHFEYMSKSILLTKVQEKEAFHKEFTQPLALLASIVKELKLNERLWSKR